MTLVRVNAVFTYLCATHVLQKSEQTDRQTKLLETLYLTTKLILFQGVLPIRNMLALFRIKHVANNKENINEKAVRPIQALI